MTLEQPAYNPNYKPASSSQQQNQDDSYSNLPIAVAVPADDVTPLPNQSYQNSGASGTATSNVAQPYVPASNFESSHQAAVVPGSIRPPATNQATVVQGTIRPPGATTAAAASAPAPPTLMRNIGRRPVEVTCPYCNHRGMTRTRNSCDGGSCIYMVVTAIVFWPLMILPCCVSSLRETSHYCRNCSRKVGATASFVDCC
mmetsp:Transcript_40216/g.49005  ORF Transcript_40216/g.49005 Transcript_40216/m.49005 type:complete len:200 (-) Transcript_40216:205-804(-)